MEATGLEESNRAIASESIGLETDVQLVRGASSNGSKIQKEIRQGIKKNTGREKNMERSWKQVSEIKKLLKDWNEIIKPIKKYIEQTRNPIPIVEGNE